MTPPDIALIASNWARERAEEHLAFIGDTPFKGLDAEKAKAIKTDLVFFAQLGATETVRALERHGNELHI
jgi:hypothetical protein